MAVSPNTRGHLYPVAAKAACPHPKASDGRTQNDEYFFSSSLTDMLYALSTGWPVFSMAWRPMSCPMRPER